jgi:hypothetical protein
MIYHPKAVGSTIPSDLQFLMAGIETINPYWVVKMALLSQHYVGNITWNRCGIMEDPSHMFEAQKKLT